LATSLSLGIEIKGFWKLVAVILLFSLSLQLLGLAVMILGIWANVRKSVDCMCVLVCVGKEGSLNYFQTIYSYIHLV